MSNLANAMKIKEGASYDFTRFSIPEFAKDFEEVMQARSEAKLIANRPSYEGFKLDVLFDKKVEAARPYSYLLSALWTTDFLKGDRNV